MLDTIVVFIRFYVPFNKYFTVHIFVVYKAEFRSLRYLHKLLANLTMDFNKKNEKDCDKYV